VKNDKKYLKNPFDLTEEQTKVQRYAILSELVKQAQGITFKLSAIYEGKIVLYMYSTYIVSKLAVVPSLKICQFY